MDQEFVFEGRVIRHKYDDEVDDVLFLYHNADHNTNNPLAKRFAEAIGEKHRQVSVRYFISTMPLTEDQRTDAEVHIAVGEGYAEFFSHYSELTGYLWTDQEMIVDGHDLDKEIGAHEGKWCRLELTVHNTTSARC